MQYQDYKNIFLFACVLLCTLRCLITEGIKINKGGEGGECRDFKNSVDIDNEWKKKQMFNIDAQF